MSYQCPICSGEMIEILGDKMHPGDGKFGVILECPSRACPAQEVAGHGDNVKQAWEIVQSKFKRK